MEDCFGDIWIAASLDSLVKEVDNCPGRDASLLSNLSIRIAINGCRSLCNVIVRHSNENKDENTDTMRGEQQDSRSCTRVLPAENPPRR